MDTGRDRSRRVPELEQGVTDGDLLSAALAPTARAGRGFQILAGALAVAVVVGMAAFVHQLRRGGLAVTGLNDRVFWATYETDLVAFIGLSYGGALVSAILRLSKASWRGPISRIAEASALVTLAVGALFPIIHLGHPELIWELFARPQLNSPLFWDMVAILTYLLATVVLFGLPLIPDLAAAKEHPDVGDRRLRLYRWASAGWRGTARQRTVLDRALTGVSILVIPLAVMVHTVLSYAFSLTSRPGWHSTIFGPYFVVAAVYSGIALVILAAVAYRRAYRLDDWIDERSIRLLGFLMAALGVAYAYFTFTELTTEGYVGEKATEAVLYLLMMKRYTVLFWLFVALGLVAPVLLIALRRTRTVGGITLAAALVVAAMWLKRLLIVVPPLARPLLGEAWGSYAPSWVEVAITLGAAAAVVLLMMLLFRVVPVLSVHEIREIRRARLPGQPVREGPPGGSARVAATRLEGGGEP